MRRSVGEEGNGEKGRHAVADLGEAGGENAVGVEVEAVGFLRAGDMLAGDAELPGPVEDSLGAVGPAREADAEREAFPVWDNGVGLRLERKDRDRGVR